MLNFTISNLPLSYVIWDVDPRVLEGLDIPRWYGLCWAMGVLASIALMGFIYKKEKLSESQLDQLAIYLIIGTLVGARFGHVLFYDPVYYWKNPIEILPIKINPHFEFTGLAGLASHGGGLGVLTAIYFYSKKQKLAYLWLLDRISIIVALCGAFIRFGNLINSEMIGIPTDVPWAFIFQQIDTIPRHPAQLYESLYCLVLFLVLFWVWLKKRAIVANGLMSGSFITLLLSGRFVGEFFKINQEDFENQLFINMGQILSIPFIIAGISIASAAILGKTGRGASGSLETQSNF